MRWRVDTTRLTRNLVWVCLVLAVAIYGSVVVRNVTETMVAIARHQPSIVVAQRPNR
jgi:hypothetical protein